MRFFRPSTGVYESLSQMVVRLHGMRVVFFGEQHEVPAVLEAQLEVMRALRPQFLVMEMFNFQQQQPLLDAFASDQISLHQLQLEYQKSDEGFNMEGKRTRWLPVCSGAAWFPSY